MSTTTSQAGEVDKIKPDHATAGMPPVFGLMLTTEAAYIERVATLVRVGSCGAGSVRTRRGPFERDWMGQCRIGSFRLGAP